MLTFVQWSQMRSLLHAILGPFLHNRFVSSSWIRQTVLEERRNLFSHAYKVDSLSSRPPPYTTSLAPRSLPLGSTTATADPRASRPLRVDAEGCYEPDLPEMPHPRGSRNEHLADVPRNESIQ